MRARRTCSGYRDTESLTDVILASASQLDDDMLSILRATVQYWQYERVFVDGTSELIYESFYDIYGDHPALEISNTIRASRFPILDMIQEQCRQCLSSSVASLSPIDYLARIQLSVDSILDITSAICASIPQLAGYLYDNMGPAMLGLESMSIVTSKSCTASAYSLLWPLFVYATNESALDTLRMWTVYWQTMEHLASTWTCRLYGREDGKGYLDRVLKP